MKFFPGMKPLGCIVTAALTLLLAAPTRMDAQDPVDPDPYDPPLFSFEGGRVDLMEAVRLTLQHDPNLLLQKEDVRVQEGVLQELAGAFDWTLTGDVSYQHEERELRDSVKQREQDERDDLTVLNGETCSAAELNRAKAAELQDAIDAEPGTVPISTDDLFNLQLETLEQAIEEATTEELAELLRNERLQLLGSELIEAEGLAEGNQQACDETAASLNRLGETPTFEDFDSVRLNLRLDKLYRSGLIFSPFLTGEYDSTRFVGKRDGFFEPVLDENGNQVVEFGVPRRRFFDFGGKNVDDVYTLRVGFEVNIPLLRNRGAEAVAASESAAREDLEATALLLNHAASQSVLATATAYWNLHAAQERAGIFEGSVKLQEQLVKLTRELIEADELPRAELARVLASEANARAQLQGARRDLVASRLGLIQAMGLDTESQANAPLAGGAFPAAPAPPAIERLLASEALVDEAVERRYDVAAARKLKGSSRILARAAQINVRSQLDLTASLWTTATGEKSLSEATDRWVTPSWSLGLAYEKPFGNSEARGRLAQSEARARQDQISAADLERNVRIGVVLALASLAEARDRLANTEEAAKYFEATIAAEIEKFKVGDSTLVDTLLTEEQRTGSLLARLDALRQVAILLAQLRFETGTLVVVLDDGTSEVTLPMITALPDA